MNLLMLIIVFLAVAVAAGVFYAAWKLSGGPERPSRGTAAPGPELRDPESKA